MVSHRNPFGLPSNLKGYSKTSQDGHVKVYLSKGVIGYTERTSILKNTNLIDQYKLFVPKAFGRGNSFEDRIKPIQGNYNTCCTESFLVIGPFYSSNEVKNVITYINSRFFHFLLSLIKNTQNTTQQSYQFIPIQDFSRNWNDIRLFTKYNLTQHEISFIEKMIWPKKS